MDMQRTKVKCEFRCWGSLADFPKAPEAGNQIEVEVNGNPAVKDTIEANGIPHPEVAGILINNRGAELGQQLKAGDQIEVFPLELRPSDCGFSVDGLPALIPEWEGPYRFMLDVHLGKLARLLRLAGFDTAYRRSIRDAELVEQAMQEERIILTRDVALLKRGIIQFGYWLRSDQAVEQGREVVRRYGLTNKFDPFGRCLNCNGMLEQVEREKVWDRIPPLVKKWEKTIYRCQNCEQLYWQGTHYGKLHDKLERMRDV